MRVPVGTVPQPCSLATRLTYSLEVAHFTKVCAAAPLVELAGMARFQVHSQFAPFGVTATGACAKATLSATFDCLGSLMNEAAMVASTHMPHLPSLNSARFSLKLLAEAPGGP
ncbi:hypothetical protein D3C86_1393050 [compost metagenome]